MSFLRRAWLELLALVLILSTLYLLPLNPARGLELFLFKALLVSASFVHATITRKLLFPYIDFRTATKMHQVLVVAIYVMTAYVYAQGG